MDIACHISVRTGDAYRQLSVGDIYWVPGQKSKASNDYVLNNRFRLNRRMRADESVMYDLHFRIATDEQMGLFGQHKDGYLFCPLLSGSEYWDVGYAFLEADLSECSVPYIEDACLAIASRISQLNDDILDGKNILDRYTHFQETIFSISGLPHRRIQESLGQLLVNENTLRLTLSSTHTEIKMPAMSRALYVLYLKHPDGLKRSQIRKNPEELAMLYKKIMNRTDLDPDEVLEHNLRNDKKSNLSKAYSRCKFAIIRAIPDTRIQTLFLIKRQHDGRYAVQLAKMKGLISYISKS